MPLSPSVGFIAGRPARLGIADPGCLCGHGGGHRLVVGVDGAGDALADLAQLPGLGLGQRVED